MTNSDTEWEKIRRSEPYWGALQKEVTKVYSKESATYFNKRRFYLSYIIRKRMINRLLEVLDLLLKRNNDIAVLNIGCGPGWVEKNVQVKKNKWATQITWVALDLSTEMIKETKKNAIVEGVVAAAEYLPFRKQSFDLILCVRAIKFMNLDIFYRNCNEVLKERGILHILFDSGDVFFVKLLESMGKIMEFGFNGKMLRVKTLLRPAVAYFNPILIEPLTFLPITLFNLKNILNCKLIELIDRPKKGGRLTTVILQKRGT